MQHKSLAAFQKPLPWHMVSLALDRDSPDESQTGVNIRAFPAFPQDSREVRTATGASGSPNGGRGADLAIFPDIWTHSSRRALERMTIERLTLALVARRLAIALRDWNEIEQPLQLFEA